MRHPETMFNRKRRLSRYLGTHSSCPTTDGTDLAIWEELMAARKKQRTELDRQIDRHRRDYEQAQEENFKRALSSCWLCSARPENRPCDCDVKREGK